MLGCGVAAYSRGMGARDHSHLFTLLISYSRHTNESKNNIRTYVNIVNRNMYTHKYQLQDAVHHQHANNSEQRADSLPLCLRWVESSDSGLVEHVLQSFLCQSGALHILGGAQSSCKFLAKLSSDWRLACAGELIFQRNQEHGSNRLAT